ncbi:hypothetical protein KAU43_06355 [candidate division WOR-3 bacterium]|nr:hypothetical protein [candidate division WOR-3 bacterium]
MKMAYMRDKITKAKLKHQCLVKHFEKNNLDINNTDLRRAYKSGFSTGWKQSKKFMQKKLVGGFELHHCVSCESAEYHAIVTKNNIEYLVCDTCSKTTKCTIADSEQEKNAIQRKKEIEDGGNVSKM